MKFLAKLSFLLTVVSTPSLMLFADSKIVFPAIEIKDVDTINSKIQLNDGFYWNLAIDSKKTLLNWKKSDQIIIYPNFFSIFYGTNFYLYNLRTQARANADLDLTNLPNDALIIEEIIHSFPPRLKTSNSSGDISYWEVELEDHLSLNSWREGQTIIIGSNENIGGSLFSQYKYIMISVEHYPNYIRIDKIH